MDALPAFAVTVTDVAAAASFLARLPGFTLQEHRPDEDVAVIDAPGGRVLLAGPRAGDPRGHLSPIHEVARPRTTLYFHHPNLVALQAQLAAAGIDGVRAVETAWGDRGLELPGPDGYRLHFWTLVRRGDAEVRELYARGMSELRAALEDLQEADLDLALEPGAWSIREIVHHVADSEAMALGAVTMALAEPGRTYRFNPYSSDAWSGALVYERRASGPSLDLFHAVRAHLLQLLDAVPGAWDRTVRNEAGEETEVRAFISMLASHALGHVDDIRAVRRAHGR